MRLQDLSYWIAYAFLIVVYAVGLWDLFCLVSERDYHTVSYTIRQSNLRYPMAVAIASFLFVHFFVRE